MTLDDLESKLKSYLRTACAGVLARLWNQHVRRFQGNGGKAIGGQSEGHRKAIGRPSEGHRKAIGRDSFDLN